MFCEVGGGPGEVVKVRLADVPVLYDQVDGHLAFQAADVPVTEIITQLVYLQRDREERRHTLTPKKRTSSHNSDMCNHKHTHMAAFDMQNSF